MPVNIPCPNCGKKLALQETHLGKRVRCPGCQQIFTANPPEEEAPPVEEMEAIQEAPARPARPRRSEPEEEEEMEAPAPRRRRTVDDDDDEGGRSGKPHRGGLVLTMGILSFLGLCCPPLGWIFGGIGLAMASTDLKLMAKRQMDRSGQGLTNTGKILSIVGLVIATLNAIAGVIINVSGVLSR